MKEYQGQVKIQNGLVIIVLEYCGIALLISGSYFNSTWGVKTTPFRGVKIVELNLLRKWS